MNLYVRLMNDVIEYIEQNITQPLALSTVSTVFHFSPYHFSRLFKIVTGWTVKQYILSRKLSVSCEKLKNSTVTDVAYDLGFGYPEVYSRAFKKQFGVSPIEVKAGSVWVKAMERPVVVERDIVNVSGKLTIRGTFSKRETLSLAGVTIEADENTVDFESRLKTTGEAFFMSRNADQPLYTVVNCHEDDSGQYTVFFGEEGDIISNGTPSLRIVPAGWYACFHYYGELLSMRSTFVDDYYRWLMTMEVEPEQNGVGMVNIFDASDRKNIRFLVPIKAPK